MVKKRQSIRVKNSVRGLIAKKLKLFFASIEKPYEEWVKLFGVSRQTLTKWSHGRAFDFDAVDKICSYLDIDGDQFLSPDYTTHLQRKAVDEAVKSHLGRLKLIKRRLK